uniref:Uncharacterized protein n=1 Tax=Candidatus Kentrum eta TaxID=2126337 RepID=A0A450VU12_9GAMM|nr:MAG: hypothetical protein BECKH772B_GA0070898_108291 [Candidatus Kentron sp. H]VFK08301.1 MAG: hypothetical protein BECKH772A_GA0070896_108431 [Candidatus Kentron sp. H]VFK12259.1 MAG: hypothetical protein BECKH772C_GA0070978_109451 [Candidatus Kentron sp. H]
MRFVPAKSIEQQVLYKNLDLRQIIVYQWVDKSWNQMPTEPSGLSMR